MNNNNNNNNNNNEDDENNELELPNFVEPQTPTLILENNRIKFTPSEHDVGHECSICLIDKDENVNAGENESDLVFVKTACNHHFHLRCLSKWVGHNKKTCPNCRGSIER